MFFHLHNVPVKPPPPSDSEDAEILLPSSRKLAHTKKCKRKRYKRELRIKLKSCVVTSCVWLLVFVVVLNSWERQLFINATDEACMEHTSQYCEEVLFRHWMEFWADRGKRRS